MSCCPDCISLGDNISSVGNLKESYFLYMTITSGRTSTPKLELSVVRELRADAIFVSTHASDACVA